MSRATDIAWAAGIFEGEGSIGHTTPHNVRINVAMTDKDVIERFQSIVACGTIGGWQGLPPRKYTHQWYVDGPEGVRVLRLLMPYFGTRRLARAHEVLEDRQRYIEEVTALRPCVRCGTPFRPKFQAGHRQRYCARTCWKTKRERRAQRRAELCPQS